MGTEGPLPPLPPKFTDTRIITGLTFDIIFQSFKQGTSVILGD